MNQFPKHVFDMLQQQLATTGRIGGTRYFLTSTLATSPAAGGGISVPVPVRFNVEGLALCIQGQEITGTPAAFAQCSFRTQIGGTEDLFVDGQGGPAFMPMLLAFGGVNNWMPTMRWVVPGVDWVFSFQNNTAAGTINPKVMIAVIAKADIEAMARR
jgi:hypothetical protein